MLEYFGEWGVAIVIMLAIYCFAMYFAHIVERGPEKREKERLERELLRKQIEQLDKKDDEHL